MGIFSKKSSSTKDLEDKKQKKVEKNEEAKSVTVKSEFKNDKLFSVLKKIRITEKGTDLSADQNTIVFEIDKKANKIDVAKAVEKFYGVKPKKVNIIRISSKNVTSRGKKGVKSGGKKAYVFLNEGDKIEAV